MPSIAEIRNMYPDAKDASDEQIISWTAQRAGMSLQDAAEYFGVSSGKKKNAALAGLSSGYEDTKGIFNSTGAALADVAGVDSIRDYFNKKSESNQIRSEIEGRPDLERVEDQNLGSALPYLAYQTGKQATNLVGGIAAGVLTPEVAVPAWLARGAAIAPRAIGGGGAAARVAAATAEGTSTFAARRAAAEAGQTFGKQVVGGAAFNEAQSIGSLYQNSVENPEDQNPGLTALKWSLPYALAETLPEAGLAGRFGHGSGFTGNFLQRAGKNALMSGASGATSELSQTAMEINVGKPLTAEQEFSQYLNAGVAGGAVEGLMGGLTGGFHKAHGKSLIEGGNTPTNEIQQAFQQNPTITPVGTTPGVDMAAQMSGTAGRVDPLTGRSSLVGTQAGTTPEFDMAAQMGGTADRVNPLAGRSSLVDQTATPITAPAVSGGTTDIAQAQAAAQQQNQQVNQAQKEQAAREDAFSKIGAVYNPEGQGSLQIFGQTILGPQVNTFGTALASKVAALPDHAHEITNAIAQANTALATKEKPSPLVSFTYNGNNPIASADKVMQALAKATDKFQIGHVDSVQMAADNLNTLSVTAKGNQLEQINAIHEALTGRDTDGYIASQQTKGAKNGQQQQQLQTTSGLGNVSVEGGTGEVSGTNVGDVRPSGIQSLLTGSQPQGQVSQQTGQPSGEGIRTGTSVTTDLSGSQPATGQVNEQAQAAQAATSESGQPSVSAVAEPTVAKGTGARVYTPTIGYYATDLSHISPKRRVEIRDNLIRSILAPKQEKAKGMTLQQRIEMVVMALTVGDSHAAIAEQLKVPVTTIEQQLIRLGITVKPRFTEAQQGEVSSIEQRLGIPAGTHNTTKDKFAISRAITASLPVEEVANLVSRLGELYKSAARAYGIDKPKEGKAFDDLLLDAGETYRSSEFPDGIGAGEIIYLYSHDRKVSTKDTVTDQYAKEMGASTKEQLGNAGFGTIKTGGGSQGAVGTQATSLFKQAEKIQTELESLEAGTPEYTAKAEQLAAVWDKYAKKQASSEEAESATTEPTEGEEDAVQVESADEGNVRQPARGGKKVGEGNAKPEKPARKTKQETPAETKVEEVKTPEEQWNELRTLAPELPAYADLNKDQRIRFDDLANRGKANLAAVVNQIVTAPATEIATEKRQTISDVVAEEKPTETKAEDQPKFGKSTAPTKPYTAQSLIAELKAFMRVDSLGRNVIIVDDVAELEDMRDQAIGWSNDRAFGWTRSGKAILIASRIQEGQGRAKFMHEVGSHLGLDRMLAEKDIVSLAGQISKWADLNNNSKESVLARKAIERVGNANVADEDVMSELIAYFVEEAILSGIDPSAASKMTGAFGNWFRTLWAGFKNAVRKLGFKPESLTAQDVVNMAYGAARLEVAGTWHGTAAEFRKFNHQYMGTGEGAQAYGWGTYLAQRYGIAEEYRVADIRRKGAGGFENTLNKFIGHTFADDIVHPLDRTLEVYKGLEITKGNVGVLARKLHALGIDEVDLVSPDGVTTTVETETPKGSLMRVDVAVKDEELLNWDAPFSEQSKIVQDAIRAAYAELNYNVDTAETGGSTYGVLVDDFKYQAKGMGKTNTQIKKMASELLEKHGVKGIRFLDARSRNKDEKQIMFNGKTYSREDLINMKSAKGTPIPLDQITTLRHVLRHGVEETIKEYQAKVDRTEKQIFTINRETAEKYKVRFNEAEELARAKQRALGTYEAKQIEFLKTANVKIVGNKDITRNLVVFNDANIFRVANNIGADKEKVKFGINPAATVDETISRLPPFVRTPTRNLVTNLLHQAKNAVYASAITEDVVKLASKYMKSANDYLNAQYARQATRIQFEQRINSILSDFDKLSDEYKGTGANSVNKFIKDSTVSGKWGYYPGEHRVGTDLFTVDPDMKLRFDAFGKDSDAQKVIKAVFEHGYEALMLKKKAVEAAIDREFADREKAAMGDTEQIKELAAEKKLLLAREAKVRGIDVSSPYAYLGRYGDYVVVAKSAEFKHYEERAKLGDWDVKQSKRWLQDNISNADHYVVQFAETQAEADAIADRLHATGNYDIMPEDAGAKEAQESYTGGGDIHLAVARLRNLLQRQVSDGDMSSVNFHSMNKMVGDLYLMTVAEASARKSEMQRKNVSGADDNMMRNLATSGRADAHFLSSLEHNDAITDSMERMRDEARNRRREAMPIYNELVKRQANSMEYKSPGPLSVALTRMNTLWSLTFSPAFYLQQVTQTAVISVPYLAGRIGYGNAVSQVNRGYKEIAGLIKGLGINEHIDFSKAPADVRDMLNKLVGMGKIDISMDSAERATADEKGVFAKVMYKMQGVNNRIEAVNRSVAAIAAYRGYLERYGNNNTEAATQYAAQVVSDTHGSYDGFNTPRALSNGIGRVVGQFRRFQIIQLSMLARLMHNAFKGASAEEKMVARKALGFITAQMAVLGGAMAVPFVSQIAWMMSKILGDPDEPDDFEFKLRRLIDNKVVSDLLLRGVPAALGIDVSDKLGMGRVASILPFAQGDLTSRSGAEKIIVAAMGPSASMGMKFADAFGMLLHGDYYKGLEMAMPNGVANVMKASRFATEGITMRNGDLVLKPEDFGMVDAAFQAVGLPTNTVTDRQFTQNVKAEYDKFYAQKSTDIKGEYVKAYRAGDAQGMARAREEFQQMEESRVSNGYKRLPMSELLKAPMAAMKRERGVIGGVETTKQNKGFVQLASQI